MVFTVKRIYEPYTSEDGFRVLVDRLWPRGITKEAARIDLWLKEIAPSPDLRKSFCHDPEKWEEFRSLYIRELNENHDAVKLLLDRARNSRVTLLYAARDEVYNHAAVLKEFLGRLEG